MRIAYNELAHYNNGELVYKWFDLDGLTKDEHEAERQEWLDSLPPVHDCPCEEWCVGDVDDMPVCFYDDYGIDEDFWAVNEYLSNNSHYDIEAIVGYINNCGSWSESNFENSYCGHFMVDRFGDSAMRQYAQQSFMDCNEIPTHLESYIGWDRVEREYESAHWEHEGHIYRSC